MNVDDPRVKVLAQGSMISGVSILLDHLIHYVKSDSLSHQQRSYSYRLNGFVLMLRCHDERIINKGVLQKYSLLPRR